MRADRLIDDELVKLDDFVGSPIWVQSCGVYMPNKIIERHEALHWARAHKPQMKKNLKHSSQYDKSHLLSGCLGIKESERDKDKYGDIHC